MRTLSTSTTLLALTVALPALASAQAVPPPGLASLELERSRSCVDVLARLDQLDTDLAPMAERSQRLLTIAEAIALEDDRIVEALDSTDPVEGAVAAWFAADQELAQRYVATLSPGINDERAAGREEIRTTLQDALTAVQAEADSVIGDTGDLTAMAAPCDGAIFVRPAVLEACQDVQAAVCDEAAGAPSATDRFRFVDSAEDVWEVQEMRPWTEPTPLFATAQGQLDGARTIGYVRTGNVVLTVSFSPLLSERSSMNEEELRLIAEANTALGIQMEHPEIVMAPALAVRATLPQALAEESRYVLHFGSPADGDIVWTGDAGTGEVIEAAVPITPAQVNRLSAGDAITLSALRELGPDEAETVFTIELPSVNQARASQALLAYMIQQLGLDLEQLVRPGNSG